jgi:hypothetical protein
MSHPWKKRWAAARADGTEAVGELKAEMAFRKATAAIRQHEEARDVLSRLKSCTHCGAGIPSTTRTVCPPCEHAAARARGRA